jgi:hypothetical protein
VSPYRPSLLAAAALASAAALTACGQDHIRTGPAGAGSQQAATVPSPAASAATTTAPAPPPPDAAGTAEGAPPVVPDAAAATRARTRATAFLRAFARTDLDQAAWWNGVAGYFTPAAASIYHYTDVVNVPVHQVVEGSARLAPDTTPYRAQVTVRTDIGTYTVTLIRAGGDWLVDRATPPQ